MGFTAKGVAAGQGNSLLRCQVLNVEKILENDLRTDSEQPIRIIVADDRRLCRECLRLLIETIDPRLDVVEAHDVDEIGPLLGENGGRSVVLYNLVITDGQGIEFVETLSGSIGNMPLVVMCDVEDGDVMRGCLERGARAFLPSTTPGPLLVAILHLVIAGGTYAPPTLVLDIPSAGRRTKKTAEAKAGREEVIAEHFPSLTPRQRHVLGMLSQGMSNRDIAASLSMCENTVKAHVKQVMRKLQADNRTQAALLADRLVN